MSMPLPPTENIRQMRFSNDFWMVFFSTLTEFDDDNLINLANLDTLDQQSADLFFTTLAARMIDTAGADNMPNVDDTIYMIRIILEEELKDRLTATLLDQIATRMENKE